MKKTTIFTNFFKEKTGLFEFILIVVIIGLSIEMIASAYLNILKLSDKWNLIIGLLLLLTGSFYFVFRIYNLKKTQYHILGFISCLNKDKMIVNIPEYKYGESISNSFNSAILENEAIRKQWQSEPLNCRSSKNNEGIPKSHKLLIELTEYYIFKTLSNELSKHFNQNKFSKKNLLRIERNNIPQILFENTFLELFSKPMEQRPAFVDDFVSGKKSINKNVGKIVASFKNGFMFEHFELILPKGTKITREEGSIIKIDTPRITIKFKIEFVGFNTNLPLDFEKYYLGINEHRGLDNYQIDIFCDVDFKLRTFITNSGWEYFTWIDTFLNELDKGISKKHFFEKINWKTLSTMLKVVKHLTKDEKKEELSEFTNIE